MKNDLNKALRNLRIALVLLILSLIMLIATTIAKATTTFLPLSQAKSAILYDGKQDEPTREHVEKCHRESPRRITCTLVEEYEPEPTTIEIMSGRVRVTLQHGYVRVHRI